MTAMDGWELYAIFLDSDWWINLSRRKRRMVGRCERCGSRKRLQSHHRRYPENWFDVTLADLECLCRDCHLHQHGLPSELAKEKPEPVVIVPGVFRNFLEVLEARSERRISREEFKQWKAHFNTSKAELKVLKRARKIQLWRLRPTHRKKHPSKVPQWQKFVQRRFKMKLGHRTKWENRGTTSN